MNEKAAGILAEVLRRHGTGLLNEPLMLENYLRDYFRDEYQPQLNALVFALRQQLPAELKRLSGHMPREIMIDNLSARLQARTGLSAELCRWAVETLAGVTPGGHSAQPQSAPFSPGRQRGWPAIFKANWLKILLLSIVIDLLVLLLTLVVPSLDRALEGIKAFHGPVLAYLLLLLVTVVVVYFTLFRPAKRSGK